jgi:ubiquinone/menaquinone biosynthesis C-methylase UbiE
MWQIIAPIWYIFVLLLLIRKFSPEIYDFVIVKMTSVWYQTVLERVSPKSRILDIGIGTGTALARNGELIREKELNIVGIDYELSYVQKCEQVIRDTPGMAGGRVLVICKSVYDSDLLTSANKVAGYGEQDKFDSIYFSGSISLMPNPSEALKNASEQCLKPNGLVYITQTFQRKGTKVMEIIKPLLKYITTIDFGKLTYEHEVDQFCKDSGLEMIEKSVIPNSIDNYFQAAFLIVLRKKN